MAKAMLLSKCAICGTKKSKNKKEQSKRDIKQPRS